VVDGSGRRDPGVTLRWLVGATAVGSLGLAAGGSAGALVANHVSGTGSTSGLPLTALAVGSALSIVGVAQLGRRVGRPPALAVGYGLGAVGALLVLAATARSDLGLVLVGSLLLGGPNAAVFLTRYAATDLVAPGRRGRALGLVLGSVTVGAVGGSYLLGPTADVADALGLPPVVGLYLLAVPAFVTAGLVLAHLEGRRDPVHEPGRRRRRMLDLTLGAGPVRRAAVLLATANLAMTAVMVVIPVHLTRHGHGLHLVGGLIGLHVAGMFCPSPLSGWLADRLGGERLGRAGLVVLTLTATGWAVTGATGASGVGALLLALGIGWNAAVVGGSALIVTTANDPDRLGAEAGSELAKEAGAGVGAPIAGVVAVLLGFPALCLLVGLVCVSGLVGLRGGAREPGADERRATTTPDPRPAMSRPEVVLRPPPGAPHPPSRRRSTPGRSARNRTLTSIPLDVLASPTSSSTEEDPVTDRTPS
jgi:MFS family permease